MNPSRILAVGIALVLIVIQTVNASFGICVADNYRFKSMYNIVGFQIWNDQGDNGNQYRSVIRASKTDLQNNGWKVHLKFYQVSDPNSYIYYVSVSHTTYGDIGEMKMNLICQKKYEDRVYRAYYTCFDNGGNYCTPERYASQYRWCQTQINMGTDTDTCA